MSPNTLERVTQKLLDEAKSMGANEVDVIATEGQSISVDVRQGSLENADRAEGVEVGLRVLVSNKQAIVSSSNISDDTLKIMVERAIAMAKDAPKDKYAGLASEDQLAKELNLSSLEICDVAPEPSPLKLQEEAKKAESSALEVSGISQVSGASASYGKYSVFMAASNGFTAMYDRSSYSVSCVAIAGEGSNMERDYDADTRVYQSDLRSSDEIGRTAGLRAAERLKPRRPATGDYPVLYDERVSSGLVGHFLSAINGAAVARGSSWLKNSLGKKVMPTTCKLVEDPHRLRSGVSRLFDAEGLPTKKREIVSDGVLNGWTLDLSSARKLGMESTANASRGVSSNPSPSNWNIELSSPKDYCDNLLNEMKNGLVVTSLIGSTINPNTGDYSRGASGFWVEDGQICYPVSEITIAGNLKDILNGIVLGNDARRHLSYVVPSILVESMTLAGS
jgi:PmbA protein